MADHEEAARARLDAGTFARIADAAGEGITARRNEEALRERALVPRMLRDVGTVDTSVTVLGQRLSSPIGVAPLPQMLDVHPEGERALAEAAAQAGVVFCAATNSSVALDELLVDGGHAWFQLYPHRDSGVTRDLLRRAVDAGYEAIVVTVDRPVPGPKASEASKSTDVADYPNLAPYGERAALERHGAGFTWRELAALREACGVPLVVKGVLHEADAREAVQLGCEGVWVSNHGGRQLDRAVASVDALARVAEELDGAAELFLDGGIRQGLDAVIAAALGARAVFMGRPLAYALAVDGSDGVLGVLTDVRGQLANAMSLMGAARLEAIERDSVR